MKLSYKNLILLLLLSIFSFSSFAQVVRMQTRFGNIDVELNPDVAPNTVANFLNYVNRGDYNNSIIHRNGLDAAAATFVIQGGGFYLTDENELEQIPAEDPIDNEFNSSNLRGTIAMAKTSDPNSATNQWFINTTDNTFLDDPANSGGFTVFGNVIRGMEIVDLISTIKNWDKDGQLQTIPLFNYPGTGSVNDYVISFSQVAVYDEERLNINAGLSGAWFNPATSGQGIMMEILPESNLVFMAWFTFDTQLPTAGDVATVGYAGHRWLTGLGEINHETNTITFDIVLTTGGIFDNTQAVENSTPNSYGSVTIGFEDCSNATVEYSFTEQTLSGSFAIEKVVNDNVALCESLSE